MRKITQFILAFAIATLGIAPAVADTVGSANFSGIKVTNPKTNQTLSFLIVPKFDQVFSADGKTTYQMGAIKAGQYVKVYYDQKFLGQRHADRILLLTQGNHVMGKQ